MVRLPVRVKVAPYLAYEHPARLGEWVDISDAIELEESNDYGHKCTFYARPDGIDKPTLVELHELVKLAPVRMIYGCEGRVRFSPWQIFHCLELDLEKHTMRYEKLEKGEFDEAAGPLVIESVNPHLRRRYT